MVTFFVFGNFFNLAVNPITVRVQRRFSCDLLLRKNVTTESVAFYTELTQIASKVNVFQQKMPRSESISVL